MPRIFQFLRSDIFVPFISILRQIVLYSLPAMGSILLIGLTGKIFLNSHTLLGCVFMGMAGLTALHMQVMQNMYNRVKAN
jgi:hypothetical protein